MIDWVMSCGRSCLNVSKRKFSKSIPIPTQRERKRETNHDIHIQPLADVPRDMAVERPDARIIRDDIDDKISRVWTGGRQQQLRIAPLHITRVDRAVPVAHALGNDPGVVAVQMHRVRCGTVVAEDDTDGGVLAEVVDVPLRVVGVGGVAGVSEVEEGDTAVVLERVPLKCGERLTRSSLGRSSCSSPTPRYVSCSSQI